MRKDGWMSKITSSLGFVCALGRHHRPQCSWSHSKHRIYRIRPWFARPAHVWVPTQARSDHRQVSRKAAVTKIKNWYIPIWWWIISGNIVIKREVAKRKRNEHNERTTNVCSSTLFRTWLLQTNWDDETIYRPRGCHNYVLEIKAQRLLHARSAV